MDARNAAKRLVERYLLTAADLVVEVDSGVDSLLPFLREFGLRVLAVEPEASFARTALVAGIDSLCSPFDSACADLIRRRYGPVRLLIARFPAVPGAEFLAACVRCLEPTGAVVLLGDAAATEWRPLISPMKRAA